MNPIEAQNQAPKRHTLRLVLRGLLTALVLLLAGAIVALAALWAWAGSGHSVRWAWDRVAPGTGWQAVALEGSLRNGLRAQRIRWTEGGWDVVAEDVEIDWLPQALPALRDRQLHLARLKAGTVRVLARPSPAPLLQHQTPGAPPAPPAQLSLPWAVQVEDLQLGRFDFAGAAPGSAGQPAWTLRDVSGRYRYDLRQHHLALREAQVAHPTLGALALSGEATLGDRGTLPLALRLQGRWEPPGPSGPPGATPRNSAGRALPGAPDLRFEASAEGPLARLGLQLRLGPADASGRLAPVQAHVQATLTAWQRQPWQTVQGRLADLDLSGWWPQAPQTRLRGTFRLLPAATAEAAWSAQVDLTNALPGTWREGRLPLAQLRAEGRLDDRLLRELTLQLAEPGRPPWRLRLQGPVSWQRDAHGVFALGGGAALLSAPARATPARLQWDGLRWGPGTLQTRGRLTGLPLDWLALAMDSPPAGDLVFEGEWDLQVARPLRLRARLSRASGDLSVLAETADGLSARVAAGVHEATLTLEGNGQGAVALALHWSSERAGQIEGRVATRLFPAPAAPRGAGHSPPGASPGPGPGAPPAGWHWPPEAPLEGQLQARLPRLAVWSLLAPAGWRLRGALAADVALGGSRAQPRWQGTLRADGLGLRSVVDGIALQDGTLRARLDDRVLHIDELVLHGQGEPGRAPPAGGRLRASGEARWPEGDAWQLTLDTVLEQLRASLRADRQLTVSGRARAEVAPARVALQADLRVDQARINLPERPTPRLGDDVVVRNLPPGVRLEGARGDARAAAGHTLASAPPAASAAGATGTAASTSPSPAPPPPLSLQARIALGDEFRVTGRGLDALARGVVDGRGESFNDLRLAGAVDLAGGRYQAFGQRLRLERALLRFTGPPQDPALDLLAVRPSAPSQSQRVGVQVTGRAQAPRVRLWSDPPLPEAQALSWLALGRASAGDGAETALLQELAMSTLARRAGLGGGTLAQRMGLDELSLRREGEAGALGFTLGKRLSQDLYAVYERGVAGAVGTLRVFYDITRRLQLRLEAGDRAGADLIFTITQE